MMKPLAHRAVMASRRSPPKALDFFPTPPWAVRAGIELIQEVDASMREASGALISDPACGAGHMSHVQADTFGDVGVQASDVFDYGWGHEVGDFLSPSWREGRIAPDWIMTNPPFSVALDFALLALQRAERGVALLLRSAFAEGVERHRRLFEPHPPLIEAAFCERVPMVEGRWDPEASTATSYSWFIWTIEGDFNTGLTLGHGRTDRRWIAPGTRDRLWMPDDIRRFTVPAPVPLLEMLEG